MVFRFLLALNILISPAIFSQDKKNYSIKLNRTGTPEILRLVSASKGLVLYDFNLSYFNDIKQKIKYPKKLEFIPKDTAYTEITSKTSNCESILQDRHILVFNAKSANPLLFLDDKIPFDYSQSKPISLGNSYTLQLYLKKFSTVSYTISKQKENEGIFPAYSFPMLEIPPLDIKNWLIIQDSFIKAGDFKKEGSSFSLALYDQNADGVYNKEDKILIDVYKQDYFLIFNNDIVSVSKIQDTNTFEADGHYFQITKIARDGSDIYFTEIPPLDSVTIKKAASLPNATYISSNDENKNLKDHLQKGKYLYIEIWAAYCPPCIRAIPLLNEIDEKYNDKLNILGLFDSQNMAELKGKMQDYNIKYPQGLSNKTINMNLLLNGYPHGVLFDDTGKIVKFKVDAKELKQFMENLK